jgi:hypothetical protein
MGVPGRSTAATRPPAGTAAPSPDLVDLAQGIAAQLRDAAAAVTMSEYRVQEPSYDEHSHNGRELLYLAANDDWNRGTRELVDISAANVVDTEIEIHVDLSRVTHEAFRERSGTVWLPLLVLPPVTGGPRRGGGGRQLVPSPRVTDAAGATLPPLPQAEARQWIAAAFSEIILNLTPLVAPPELATHVVRREHRLLLSAAIHRVLRDGTDESVAGPAPARMTSAPDGSRVGRVENARRELHELLDGFRRTVANPGPDDGRAALLIRRAAQILHAVSHPTSLVVVGVPAGLPSTAFRVAVPSRSLRGYASSWFRAPRARVELELLLPSVGVDRDVEIRLPRGVSLPRDPGSGVGATIEVDRPRALRQVDELMRQVGARPGTGHDPVLRCLVDFTLTRVEVARDAFRSYRQSADEATPGHGRNGREAVPAWLESLRGALHTAAALPGDADATDPALADLVRRGRDRIAHPPSRRGLFRVLEADTVNPTTAHVRVPAVENVAVRSSPRRARVTVDVAVDESGPLHAARYSGLMSLLILLVVVVDLQLFGNRFDAQVLGGVLTLFAVIQAGRVEHPDRATLRGLLVSGSTWVLLASILPTVLLGVTLAFVGVDSPDLSAADADARRALVPWLAGAALAGQFALQVTMHAGPLARATRARGEPRLHLVTGLEPDHLRIDVLGSSWWRTTTAGALLLGLRAHAYAIRQRGPGIRPVLDTRANILAMLRAGTAAQALTFVVFREQPEAAWQSANDPVTLQLDADRLIATEATIGNVDVFVGLPAGRAAPVGDHPLSRILAEARARERAVTDVQLPAPPPPGASRGHVWSRVRIGLRSNETGDLDAFLDAVHRAVASGSAEAELLVDMASQTPPRRFLGAPGPLGAGTSMLRPEELDVVSQAVRAGAPAGTPEWFVLAVTGYARNGFEADVLEDLAAQRPGMRLAGLSTALLHGTTVAFVLGHQPGRTTGGPGAAASPPALRFRGADVPVAEWASAEALGLRPEDEAGALLRLHAVSSDLPGTLSMMLDHLAHRFGLAAATPSLPVWYAHTEVLEGRLASSRVMLRLPAYLAAERWDRARLDGVERAVRQALAAERGTPDQPGWSQARPVVGLDILRAAGPAPAPPAPPAPPAEVDLREFDPATHDGAT